MMFLISSLEDINDQTSNFVERDDLSSIKFFGEKRAGQSKRERIKIIDLHLKQVFVG